VRVDEGDRDREEFKRRIKTQTVLPSAETAAMLFWTLLASGQITELCPNLGDGGVRKAAYRGG
jgi:hypothetical protein